MSKRLTPLEIEQAAHHYDVQPALLRAIIDVESGGAGFNPDGTVKILFERHLLWKRLQMPGRRIDPRPLARAHPNLCGPKWNARLFPYGSTSSQWHRVQRVVDWASEHDPKRWESYKKAALESCSYGLFQLLGMNYEMAGYHDVYSFKHAHEQGEAYQLEAILYWMSHNGLLSRLRNQQWTRFVAGYNGIGQVPFYRGKLVAAYQHHRRHGS